jgi:protein Mpv17
VGVDANGNAGGSSGSSSSNNDDDSSSCIQIQQQKQIVGITVEAPIQSLLLQNEPQEQKFIETKKESAVTSIETTTASTEAVNSSTHEMMPDNELLRKNIFNALLLGLTFGYAAYTIFNIDHGMTRGWTQSEIAMRIPLDNWLNYESSLADRPIATKTAINVIIYLLGDWLSQTAFSGNNILNFDAARTIRNGFIGLCFGPLVHEYYQFSDHILPVDGGMFVRLQKIIMDQTIYLSVKCSIYISAVGLLQGDDVTTVKQNVQTKLPKIVLTAWKFWPLVHLVTYGVIPARHRILWVNCVDLIWNAILATMSQKKTGEDTDIDDADPEQLSDGDTNNKRIVPPLIYEATLSDEHAAQAPVIETTTANLTHAPHS